jgi:hypothetical protein
MSHGQGPEATQLEGVFSFPRRARNRRFFAQNPELLGTQGTLSD